MDDKAPISELVRLTPTGKAHRGLRYWEHGSHYLVDSQLDNAGGPGMEGTVLWFLSCTGAVVKIYAAT